MQKDFNFFITSDAKEVLLVEGSESAQTWQSDRLDQAETYTCGLGDYWVTMVSVFSATSLRRRVCIVCDRPTFVSLNPSTTDWRAVCGKTACPVRREGSLAQPDFPTPDRKFSTATRLNKLPSIGSASNRPALLRCFFLHFAVEECLVQVQDSFSFKPKFRVFDGLCVVGAELPVGVGVAGGPDFFPLFPVLADGER